MRSALAAGAAANQTPARVMCMPAHNDSDALVGLMIAVLLRRRGVPVESQSAALLASERIDRLDQDDGPSVCICAVPPSAAVHARHMVKRIQARHPGSNIVVLYCDEGAKLDDLARKIAVDDSITLVTTLEQAVEHLRVRAGAGADSPNGSNQEIAPSALDRARP
jgi:hypothetical protein